MNVKGRPKKLNPLGETFRNLYLDPTLSPEEICARMQISQATFYRYREELGAPVIRAAVGNGSGLPMRLAFKTFRHRIERYDFELIRRLGIAAGIRFKLLPASADEALQLVERQDVDIAIASVSWSKERSRTFYFSQPYSPNERPHGVLMTGKFSAAPPKNGKPKLGVPKGSIHQEFALAKLSNEFDLIEFPTMHRAMNSVKSGRCDFTLLHPASIKVWSEFNEGIEIASKPFFYESHTAIISHRDSAAWLTPIDEALERMEAQDLFNELWASIS